MGMLCDGGYHVVANTSWSQPNHSSSSHGKASMWRTLPQWTIITNTIFWQQVECWENKSKLLFHFQMVLFDRKWFYLTDFYTFAVLSYLIVTFSDSIQCLFHQANYIKGIDFCKIIQGSTEFAKFTSCENGLGVSVWRTLAWWMLSSGPSGVCRRFDCTKFLGLQTFGSFKGFK